MVRDNINFDLYARTAELAVRNKTLSLLHELDEVTLSTLTIAETTARITAIISKEFAYPFVGVGVCDAKQTRFDWLSISCASGQKKLCDVSSGWETIALKKVSSAWKKMMRTHRRVEFKNLDQLLAQAVPADHIAALTLAGKIKSVIAFPLVVDKACFGLLAIGLDRPAKDLTNYEHETFAPMLGHVAVAIQKAMTYTELLDTTAKLKTANHRLKELDAAKSEFVSIASHQLRTPLAAVRGYVDLIADGTYGKITPAQTEVVGKVHDSVASLIDLVGQLLNVSRIESGKTTVEITKVDLTPICIEVAGFLAIKAKDLGLTLTCDDHRMPPVLGDASKIKEVMMNLVENALKYTDKGSVKVLYTEEPKFVRINIKDTGVGLTKDSINKLFQKFSRVEATAANHPGTGLGLYVCKRLVEAMGGEIWIESAGLGKGSTFCVRLRKA